MNLPNRRTLLTAGAATALAGITACNKANSRSGSDSGSGSSTTTTRTPSKTPASSASATPKGPANWSALAKSLDGTLVRPGDATYPTARQLYNTRFDNLKPAAVAYVRHEADIRECLAFARRSATPVSIRSGGHSYAGWSSGNGRLVIDVSSLSRVDRDGTIGAGAKLIDVYRGLARARPDDPRRLLPDGRHLRPDPRRRPRCRVPRIRPDLRQPHRGHPRHGGRQDRHRRRQAPTGPLLGAARRGQRQLRCGHRAAASAPARPRRPSSAYMSWPWSTRPGRDHGLAGSGARTSRTRSGRPRIWRPARAAAARRSRSPPSASAPTAICRTPSTASPTGSAHRPPRSRCAAAATRSRCSCTRAARPSPRPSAICRARHPAAPRRARSSARRTPPRPTSSTAPCPRPAFAPCSTGPRRSPGSA